MFDNIIERHYRQGLRLVLAALIVWSFSACRPAPQIQMAFSGQRALAYIEQQVAFGPRTPGSPGHSQTVDWIMDNLEQAGWEARIVPGEWQGIEVKNIEATKGPRPGVEGKILLGAHYDTRFLSDEEADPQLQQTPVPGANDGASGVAVLLELASVLPEATAENVVLVFFDAEDNGNIPGWEWIIGSSQYVAGLEETPQAAIIVDMVGDAELNLLYERNSDPILSQELWTTAAELGYEEQFIAQPGYSMLDDHTPFLRANIPAVDIIDFDTPYWHTTLDTVENVSALSLEAVGKTLYTWLIQRFPPTP